jgi:hypothetical protein
MKSYNIAVCLSGEPRTWHKCAENVLNFYQSNTHNVVFFGHSWNSSDYTKENVSYNIKKQENQDSESLHNAMLSKIGYQDLIIDDKSVLILNPEHANDYQPPHFTAKYSASLRKPMGFVHMSYSIMIANWLKTRYELNNNMQFDIVVRTRHDIYHTPDKKFSDFIPQEIGPISLYGNTSVFPSEYWQIALNDTIFFGSSRVMNVVCDFYRYYHSGKFWSMLGSHWNDSYIKQCGYNVNLYKWLTIKNIQVVDNRLCFDSYVFRKIAEYLTLPNDHNEIYEYERRMFL